jgi:bacillopeptidase F (M6 metalloprotease family)
MHLVFYNKQLKNGSPEGYSGRNNKRVVKILKYNSESVMFAVDIFSM